MKIINTASFLQKSCKSLEQDLHSETGSELRCRASGRYIAKSGADMQVAIVHQGRSLIELNGCYGLLLTSFVDNNFDLKITLLCLRLDLKLYQTKLSIYQAFNILETERCLQGLLFSDAHFFISTQSQNDLK